MDIKLLKVSLIDLQLLTEQLEEKYGVENSKKLHLHYAPNEIEFYPNGIEDNTHLSVLGATEISKLVVKSLDNSDFKISELLK